MASTRRHRSITCDCGHCDEADTIEALVALTRAHAREEHNIDLPVELIRLMADAKPTPTEGDHQ